MQTGITFVSVAIAFAACVRLAYEHGYRRGRTDAVTPAEFEELSTCQHEWTEPWLGTLPDGTRVSIRGCMRCPVYDYERITG